MQVLDGETNLVGELLDARLTYLKVAVLYVVEQVLALHILQHNVVIV